LRYDDERKGINYRVSPENADCPRTAHIGCCVLTDNHVLDCGKAGLRDTRSTLQHLGIKSAGAGLNDAAPTARLAI
jgi:poly-gamma-glutamate synthesis protein (capsule biosynthesis protein)